MKRWFTSLVLILTAAVLAAPALAQPVELGFKVQPGQQFHTMTLSEQNIQQSMMGQNMTIQQTIGMGMMNRVLPADESGNLRLEIEYDHVIFNMNSGFMNIAYDSAKQAEGDPVPMPVTPLAAMLGQKLTVVFSPEMEVVAIEGLDEMVDHMAGQFGDMPAQMQGMMKQNLEQQFNEEALAPQFEAMFQMYPDQPVKVGDQWTASMPVATMPGSTMTVDSTYTFQSREGDLALLAVDSTFEGSQGEGPDAAASEDMNLTGTQSGTMRLHIPSGVTLEAMIEQELTGEMSPAGAPEGMNVPMKITGTTRITSTRPEPIE